MHTKALRCCLAPSSEKAVEANLLCKHINDTITRPSRWWVGGGKVRDKYKVVCSPPGYSFTKPHSQLLNHSGSLQKDYIFGVLAPGTVQD